MYRGWPFTGWGSINIPSTIQKRLLKFLLKRALGQFLAEELDLDLEVQLGDGLVHLKELQLNVEVLNDLVADLPVVITDGKIGGIVANIPWKNIWNRDFVLEIHNLQITVVPEYVKPRNVKTTPEDSHILSSSFHFAGDFLRHEIPPEEDEVLRNSIYHSFHSNAFPSESQDIGGSGLEQPETSLPQSAIPDDNGIEGIQILARLIDKLMSKVKIVLKDTHIRLSHQPSISSSGDSASGDSILNKDGQPKGYYFDLEIPVISFKDETPGLGDEPPPPNTSGVTLPPAQAETVKSFTITGINIWLREVTSQCIQQPSQQSPLLDNPKVSSLCGEDSGDEFFDSHSQGSESSSESDVQGQTKPYEAMILSCTEQENFIRVTIRQNVIPVIQFDVQNASSSYYYTQEAIQQANSTQSWDIEGLIRSVTAVLTPSQVSLIADLADVLSKSKFASDTRSPGGTESDYSNQFDDNYRSMSSPVQSDDIDDLIYNHDNKINLTSTRNKGGLRNHQKHFYDNPSKNDFYNLELDREPVQFFDSPPNSSYNYKPSSSSHPPYNPTMASSVLNSSSPTVASNIKIKFNISAAEFFLLYVDPLPNSIPEKKFFETRLPENLEINHIKIGVDRLSCMIQKWNPDNLTNSRKRSGSISNVNYSSSYQKSLDSEENSRVLIDVAFAGFSISEWLKDPLSNKSNIEKLKSEITLPSFNIYNPLLSFDPAIYDPEEKGKDFPNFPVKDEDKSYGYDRNAGAKKVGRTASRFGRNDSNVTKDVIKIKVEITNSSNEDTLSSTSIPPNVANYDIAVDLEPVQLHFDPRIIDRLENYLVVLSNANNIASREEMSAKNVFNEHSTRTSQHIIDDLDTQRLNEKNRSNFRLRIECDLIRFMLHCPDLGASNTHKIVEDYCIHSSLIIFDIINIVVMTGDTKNPGISRTENYGIQKHSESEGHSSDLRQNRLKIECGGINIFLKESNDSTAKCFLSGKPLAPLNHHRPMANISPTFPNIEITYKPSSAVKNKLSFIGSSVRSSPFSQTFTSFEGEDRSNWPVENEEEEILMFKQRTIESSLFVINCNFPLTRVRITKSSYDILQVLINDLTLWQPKNSDTIDDFDYNEQASHINIGSNYDIKYQPDGMNSYYSENSEMRMKLEESFRMDMSIPLRPSLASVVVFMTNVEIVMINDPKKKASDQLESTRTYQLNMTDFRFFSVIKHEGKNDTYIVLDNDNFDYLEKTQEKTHILCRTLDKSLKTKNARPMISIIMLISLDVIANMKETNLTLSVNGVTLRHSQDTRWIDDLLEFLQEPEVRTFVELPSQFIKLSVTINDSSVDFNPNDVSGRVVIALDSLKTSSNIISGSPMFAAKLIVQNLDLMLVGDGKTINERVISRLGSSTIDAKKYWKAIGFVKAASLDFAEIQLKVNKGEIYPNFELEITNENLTIETCADAFQTLLNLINHLTPKREAPETGRNVPHITTANRDLLNDDSGEPICQNMLASLDMEAFNFKSQHQKSHSERKNPVPNLEFVEEYYTVEEDGLDESDAHFFDNAVDVDVNEEDIIVEPPQYATASINHKNSKASDMTSRDDVIRSLDTEPLNFSDNHFAVPSASELGDSSIQELPNSLTRIKLRDFNLVWKLYDGYDWEHSRKEVRDALERAKAQAKNVNAGVVGASGSSGSLIGETSNSSLETEANNSLFERMFVGTPFKNSEFDATSQTASEIDYIVDDHSDAASQVSSRFDSENTSSIREGKRPEHSSHQPQLRLNRSRSSKLDIKLEKINLDFDIFPNDDLLAFRLLLLVRDIEILDNIKTSAWRKFLSHMRPDNDTSPRENKSNMIRIELNSVRPTPTDSSEELRLRARFLPLRFYIDQDALQFVIRFFSFQDSSIEKPPVEDDTYFQSIEIYPISMKIDYKPKHIDYTNLKEGNLVELMNFFHLEAAEMTLSNVKLTGVKGQKRLFEELVAAWLPHIKSTQVPNVISGVAPIRSLVNLGSGVADLILLPIEQYKKDGRVIRGLQKGTQSFARATTMEAIKFGTKLAVGTQILLEHADEILSFESQTGTDSRNNFSGITAGIVEDDFDSDDENTRISKYADQPADLNEGIEAAYKSLRTNLGTAAHTIFAVPMEVYEKTGTHGTVKAVIRAVPVAVLKPMIGASEAVSKTLLGLRNTIDPHEKLQMEDKYKKR